MLTLKKVELFKPPSNSKSIGAQCFISIVTIFLVSLTCYHLSDALSYQAVAFILLITLSFLGLFISIIPMILAAIISAVTWNFFFIPPKFTLHVNTAEDSLLFAMYFLIALIHALITFRIRQTQKKEIKKEEKANTLKLYNTLLNSLSHELRTPIATIIGATDNLLTDISKLSEENKTNLLTEISVAALRLNGQVENLLNMSRVESGFLQPKKDWCDINELIYATIRRIEADTEDHKILIQADENLPLFKLDAGLMEQVLYNLVNNAITYTPSSSVICIHAKYLDGNCIILVEDNGNGFPVDERGKVFEKFYRLKYSKTGGTGLGLSIAKGFVEAHGGTITLEAAESGGAKFVINIPTETSTVNTIHNE